MYVCIYHITHPYGKDVNWQNYLLKFVVFISLRGYLRILFKMRESSLNILNLSESTLNLLNKSDLIQKILDLKGKVAADWI